MSHRIAVFAAVLSICIVSACSDDATTPAPDETQADGGLPADIPEEINIGVPSGLTTLDPDLTVQEVDVMTLALTAGTLLEASEEGTKPALAQACDWREAATYACTLRTDAMFSDGTSVTAADVVASFERPLGDEANANAGLVTNIESVTAEGERDVIFTLKRKQASFPLVLTEGPLGIYPAVGLKDPRYFDDIPTSSGPFQMIERSDSTLVLKRNENYPAELMPVVDTVNFVKVVDPGTRALQLNTGELDLAFQVPANQAAQINDPAKLYATSQYGSLYIYMNHKAGPLGDVNVRKAISYAIDRDQINEIAFNGQNQVIASFFPTTMEGSDPDADTSRNLDQAKELLQGTECASGCTIEMMQRAGYPPYDTISTIVAANLKDVGINAEIKTVDQATANANEASGNFEMEVGGLYDVVNSPELIMLTYGLVPAGGINALFSYYENDELTKLYEQLIETEGDARTPLLDGINAIFAADMPYVPFGDFTTLWASRVSTRVVAFTSSGSFQIGTEESAPGQ